MLEKICIIGAGRTGSALALLLAQKNAGNVSIWNRSAIKGKELLLKNGIKILEQRKLDFVTNYEIIIIAVSDRAIQPIVSKIIPFLTESQIILTVSGFFSFCFKKQVNMKNFGTMHPVFPFSYGTSINKPPVFGLEGGVNAVKIAEFLCKKIGSTYFFIPSNKKIGYHAALSLLAGGIVGIFYYAEEILKHVGIDRKVAKKILLSLAMAILDNIEQTKTPSALTGPVSRNDIEVIKKHTVFLKKVDNVTSKLYETITDSLFKMMQKDKNEK